MSPTTHFDHPSQISLDDAKVAEVRSRSQGPVAEEERIVSLDVLRGVAVLGILLMNIQSFAMPGDAYLNPTAYGDLTGANRWVWIVTHLVADQKFVSIFSMLFGAGIVLMAERAGSRAAVLHYRRMGVLIVFGLLHAHLLWSGDILFSYGVVALVVYLARNVVPRRLIIAGVLLHAGSSLFFIGSGLSLRSAPPEVVAQITGDFWLSSHADLARELAAYRGTWLEQQALREADAATMETFIFFIDTMWKVSGLMLIGMALFKLGVLSARRSDAFYRGMIALGLGLGLPVVAFGVWSNFKAGWTVPYSLFFGSQYNYWGSVVVALGWIGAVMLWCRSDRALSLRRRLAAVGRMAFSNYILQTVIGTLLFFGTGFGLFGHVERVGQLLIVFGIWLVQLVVSPLWLRRFAYGPLEWLWRSLTYGRVEHVRATAIGLTIIGLVASVSSPLGAQSSFCDGPEPPLAPSRDLYCIELVPAVGIRTGSGRVELGRAPGPFTVDATADGQLRYTPSLTLSGLPTPSSLGRYSVYVAWVATPTMDRVSRLGVVANGRTILPAVALDKFTIFITAEASAAVADMRGRLVLRGMSPSTRLQPPDLMQFALGASREGAAGHAGHDADTAGASDSLRWTMVPMPPGVSMLPAEMTLRPNAAPYLPRAADAAAVPVVQPRQLVRLTSGDTLRLTAGVVRRPFKGDTLTMFAFNGQQPGPLLQVAQGAVVTVELTNALDQPTTVHWHGIRLDNAFDGVPDLTQRAVAPGERFTYRLRFPDAGIYWYHPHVREDVQQDLGLYGNLMVRSPRADYFSRADREEVLMLDDLLVGDDGRLIPFGSATTTHALMGRFGNVMLVNGEPRYALTVARREVVRFFLTNVSNTRTFNLSFPGARMKVVASDVGNYEREEWVESVVIAPAERYVVQVRFDGPGDVALVNRVRGLDHLYGRFFQEMDTLGVVRVGPPIRSGGGTAFDSLRTDTATRADIARYREQMARPVDRTLVLTMEAQGLPFFTRQIMQLDSIFFTPVEWSGTMPGMNWAATGDQVRWILRDAATGKENMEIDWTFRRGDVVKVRLVNERRSFHGMQHPIHFHGQRFLVLAVNGVSNTNLVWKDTVLLPAGATADILLDLTNPGRWMAHCHIAEHLSAHMMMAFTVQ